MSRLQTIKAQVVVLRINSMLPNKSKELAGWVVLVQALAFNFMDIPSPNSVIYSDFQESL